MRKAIKFCLALAMVGTLAIPASAADVKSKFTGRSTATFTQSTSKAGTDGAKAISYMDMSAGGRFGAQFDVDGEKWNTTAKVELGVNETSLNTRDIKVGLSNDDMSIFFGRQYVTGVAHGEDYTFPVSFTEGAGEHVIGERFAVLKFSMPNVGLDVFYGMDEVADPSDATTDTQYNRTRLGVIYSKAFGDIDLGVSYTAYSDTINKDNGGLEKGEADGRTASEIALGLTYKMDKMGFSLNYASWTTKDGGDDVKALSNNSMDLIFDMEMEGFLSGLSVAYTMASKDKMAGTEKKKVDKSAYVVGVEIPAGAASIYAGYAANSEKGSWEGAKAATSSEIGVTLYYGF